MEEEKWGFDGRNQRYLAFFFRVTITAPSIYQKGREVQTNIMPASRLLQGLAEVFGAVLAAQPSEL